MPPSTKRLARYFGNSPQFWINLQTNYDLVLSDRTVGEKIRAEIDAVA